MKKCFTYPTFLGSGQTVVAQTTTHYAELQAKERNLTNMDTFYE